MAAQPQDKPPATVLSALADWKKSPGGGGTLDAQTASPVRRRRAGTRCRRGCEPGASSARAQPAVPWSPSGEGGESGRDPSLEAAAASRAGCRARRRPQQRAGGLGVRLRGRAALGSAARPLSRPAAAEPGCFEWERVRWGWGRYLWMCCLSWLRMVRAPTPPPAPPLAPAPPLLCQPSKGGERRHPAARAATACAFRETRAGLSAGFYLFILFKGRVSHCTPWTRLESDAACPGRILDEKERLSWERVPRAIPCALPLELGALQPPWEPRKALQGPGTRGWWLRNSTPHNAQNWTSWCVVRGDPSSGYAEILPWSYCFATWVWGKRTSLESGGDPGQLG